MGGSKTPFLCQENPGIHSWEKSLLSIICSAACVWNTSVYLGCF